MKALLLTSALAAGLALPAAAQTTTAPATTAPATTPASPFQAEAAGPSVSASELIGARIYASEAALDGDSFAGVQEGWDDIGEVNDVILGRDGSVDAVLVDIGGFLGIGERQVAVDMAALRFAQDSSTDADDWFLVMQADRATLDAAPEWPAAGSGAGSGADATTGMTETPVAPDTTAGADSTTAPDATAGTDTTAATDTTGGYATTAPDATAGTDTTAATDTTGGYTTTAPDATAGTDTAAGTDTTATTPDPATGTTTPAAPFPEGYAAIAPDALTADMLKGANVHDMNDATIAEVSDLVLTPEGQATEVVVDVGGFLGIGAKQVAIPMDRVTVAQNAAGAVQVYVDMTKDELKALPEFQS